jgi:Zn-dependent protease
MVQCDQCGKDEYMPFRCKYCGGYFCSEHRLPEMHNCEGSYQQSRSTTGSSQFTPTGYSYTPTRRATRYGLFGETELRDLAIGLGVIMLIPLSSNLGMLFTDPVLILSFLTIYAMAFIIHELAHKFSAQMLGYWAEFKINQQGLMLTLFSLISPLKIIAPGAVMISNVASWTHYGKVAAAGPASNIGLGLVFFALNIVLGNTFGGALAGAGMRINAQLALFNLIPLGMFDGAKIIKWSKAVWAACIVAAGVLYLFA